MGDFDEADFGIVPTLTAVVAGNVFQNSYSCAGCPVIYSLSLESVAISENIISGGGSPGVYLSGGPGTVVGNIITGAYAGVWVDYANYVHVSGNLIWNSAEWGIAVTDGSSHNLIDHNIVLDSGAYDLYWDQTGTGNVWTHNACSTSSPPGLC